MRTLAMDTSTSTARVAIAVGGAIAGSTESHPGDAENQPSRNLLSMVNRLMKESGFPLDMMDAFAVSAGPGSFTGLRVGVGVALGLSAAMGKPAVGVETLTAMAMTESGWDHGVVCPILNARRGEVYAAFFKTRNGVMERLSADMALAPERLAEMISEPALFIGDGFRANADVLSERLKLPFTAIESPRRNTAETVAELALAGRAVIAPISLSYVRPSQAELNWEKLHAI